MKQKELQEIINAIPAEKRGRIVELLDKAKNCINSVEFELIGTKLNSHNLFLDEPSPTLWCMIYDLEKLFRQNKTTEA